MDRLFEPALTGLWKRQLDEIYAKFLQSASAADSFRDTEDLHKARVNNRKLISLLKVMGTDAELEKLMRSLQKTHKLFGRIRDRDVLIGAFRQRRREALDPGRRKLIKAFIRVQKEERKQDRSRLKKKLPKLLKKRIAKRWSDFMQTRVADRVGEEWIADYIARLEERYDHQRIEYERIKQAQGMALPDTLKALHKVRLLVKELRYVLKHAGFVKAIPVEPKRRYYEELQEPLGRANDLRVWVGQWRRLTPEELGADPEEYRRLLDELNGELKVELGKLHISRPVIG